MATVITIGSLREDITINFDFSLAMSGAEEKIKYLNRTIGGSVFNTSLYLALNYSDIHISFCTHNYISLLNRVGSGTCPNNMNIICPDTKYEENPVSIIGLQNNGEKQIISYDIDKNDNELFDLVKTLIPNATIVYSSFYEINPNNSISFIKLLKKCSDNNILVMMDLCPLLKTLNPDLVSDVLQNVSVLSGNRLEYNDLLQLLSLNDIKDLITRFSLIKRFYIKRGKEGAELYAHSGHKITHFIKENLEEGISAKNSTGCGDIFNASIIGDTVRNIDDVNILINAVIRSTETARRGLPWIQE